MAVPGAHARILATPPNRRQPSTPPQSPAAPTCADPQIKRALQRPNQVGPDGSAGPPGHPSRQTFLPTTLTARTALARATSLTGPQLVLSTGLVRRSRG